MSFVSIFKDSAAAKKAWATRQGKAGAKAPASGKTAPAKTAPAPAAKLHTEMLDGPRVSSPINAQAGLYMKVKTKGAASRDQLVAALGHHAEKHGYDPKGEVSSGFPEKHGDGKSYALWFHTKKPKSAKKEDAMSFATVFKDSAASQKAWASRKRTSAAMTNANYKQLKVLAAGGKAPAKKVGDLGSLAATLGA